MKCPICHNELISYNPNLAGSFPGLPLLWKGIFLEGAQCPNGWKHPYPYHGLSFLIFLKDNSIWIWNHEESLWKLFKTPIKVPRLGKLIGDYPCQ
jgi:hypothetical protein